MQKLTSPVILMALALLLFTPAIAQKSEKVSPKRAMALFQDGNWEKAKQMYLELLKAEPDNEEYNLYCGISHLQSRIDAEKANEYFNKVSPENIPGVLLLKAEAFHYVGEFDSASVYYENYRNTEGVKLEKGLNAMVDKRLQQCQTGKDLANSPDEAMFVENLGNEINTRFLDYAPVVLQDLKTLVFTSSKENLYTIQYMTYQEKGQEDMYYTNYDPVYKKWLPRAKPDGVVMNKSINSEGNESSITYNTDRSKFYFFKQGKLYVSENLGEPVEVELPLESFSPSQIVEVLINRAENTLFVTSDKKSGTGGMDIYMSKKESDGSWADFKELSSINTQYDEGSPFLSEDGTKLYFASKGYNSMGDYDIFVATLQGDSFTNVKNMGVPVNSPANDIHFRLTGGNEEFGYLASDRMGGNGDYDVWRFWTCFDIKTTNLNGQFLARGEGFENATLSLLDLDSNVVATANVLENGGNYSFPVGTEKPYILSLSVNEFKAHTFNLNIPDQCSEYDLYQSLTGELKMDGDSFIFEQKSTLTNAFYDIDGARGEQSRSQFLANLNPDVPYYTDPQTQVSTFEKDQMLAGLGVDPIVNADGKEVYEINFDFDKTSVSKESEEFLAKLAKGLNSNPNAKVVLVGHTDSSGPAHYNKKLSLKRAKSVAKILAKNGVKTEQIETSGMGESQLKVKDTAASGGLIKAKAKENRRVEIEIK